MDFNLSGDSDGLWPLLVQSPEWRGGGVLRAASDGKENRQEGHCLPDCHSGQSPCHSCFRAPVIITTDKEIEPSSLESFSQDQWTISAKGRTQVEDDIIPKQIFLPNSHPPLTSLLPVHQILELCVFQLLLQFALPVKYTVKSTCPGHFFCVWSPLWHTVLTLTDITLSPHLDPILLALHLGTSTLPSYTKLVSLETPQPAVRYPNQESIKRKCSCSYTGPHLGFLSMLQAGKRLSKLLKTDCRRGGPRDSPAHTHFSGHQGSHQGEARQPWTHCDPTETEPVQLGRWEEQHLTAIPICILLAHRVYTQRACLGLTKSRTAALVASVAVRCKNWKRQMCICSSPSYKPISERWCCALAWPPVNQEAIIGRNTFHQF